MASASANFKLGLFVLGGLLVAIGAVVWLGLGPGMSDARTYVTFFNESVQGLQNDSSVKYRGVDVGRVVDIRVAPDYKLIEVVMEINLEGEPRNELVAQLKQVGITGISFIELDRRQEGDADLSPRLTFAAEYPIIPSKPSELKQIFSTVERVVKQLNKVDFEAMGNDVRATVKAVKKLADNPAWAKSAGNIANIMGNVEAITVKIRDILDSGQIKRLSTEANETLASAKALLEEARAELKAMDLRGKARLAGEAMRNLDHRTARLAGAAERATGNLSRAVDRLEGVAHRLEQDPSALVFSKPPPPRQLPEAP